MSILPEITVGEQICITHNDVQLARHGRYHNFCKGFLSRRYAIIECMGVQVKRADS